MLKSLCRYQIRRTPFTRTFSSAVCILIIFAFAACLVGCDSTGSLINKFSDKDTEVQQNAMKELVAIGGPAVENLLVSLQEEKDQKTASEVSQFKALIIRTLGEIKDPRAIDPLVSVLKGDYYSNSDREAKYAGDALVNIGQESTDSLLPLLKTNTLAVDVVGRLKDPAAVEPLIEALNADSFIAVSSALVAIGEPSIAPLIATMKAKPEIRYTAGNVLTSIGAAAAGPLSQCLGDGDADMRKAVADSLISISAEVAAPYTDSIKGVVAENYQYFINKGIGGSEHFLAAALHASGNETMCVDYLNCGNQTLEGEATNWATSRGYRVIQGSGSHSGPSWNSN